MKPFLAKTLGPLTLCLIAACASKPPAPAFPIKSVETEVILHDDANILAPMLGRKYAVQQGYEDTPVPRTADPYDDATIALEEQKAEFDKVARSSEAAAWTRERIVEQIGQQIDSQAKAASATGADAHLSVEITKYGLKMASTTAMNFDSDEFGASTLAPVPMAESFFNSLSGVARVIDPATGEVLYGPFDVTGSHRLLSFTSPIEFEDQMEREANTEITKAFLQDLRRDIAGQP